MNNGDIVQRLNNKARMAFGECEFLDPLFQMIEQMIGAPIEHMLINLTARASALYLAWLIPAEVRQMVQSKQLEMTPFMEGLTTLAEVSGFAKYERLGMRYENDQDDYCKYRVIDPFSLPLAAGGYVGAVTGVVDGEHAVTYKEILPNTYEFTTHWDKYPTVLKEKLRVRGHNHKEGDIHFERCETCGAPKECSDYEWLLEKGNIRHRRDGRRMVLLSPEMIDPVFTALESELGEIFPAVVVEAGSKVMKGGFNTIDLLDNEACIRHHLAFRGFGNLVEISATPKKMSVRMKDACFFLLLAGMFQAAFEKAYDVDSNIEWEITEETELQLTVTPKRVVLPVTS
ncbi:MAG: hypothetical protein A2V52_01055 [Actinobacteria bacterium RBG_19FT_COMBO_54_7]|nr:MAG: hypothetical protein A2V52_01055 [Actinobacteria bacterium RBG_19FT_COMBO_54_7]